MIPNYTHRLPILLLLLSLHVTSLKAQNVGINPDGSIPDASAMLDIKNPNKGLLIPRVSLVSTTDVVTIPSPVVSLLVFNVNASMTLGNGVGYYTWTGTAWTKLLLTGNAWSTTGNGGTLPGTNFIGTTDNQPLVFRVNTLIAGKIDQNANNTFFGVSSGPIISTGNGNSFLGRLSGNANTTGSNNAAIGFSSLRNNSTGGFNTAIGTNSLFDNTNNFNTAVGGEASEKNTSGRSNVAVGFRALRLNMTGSNLVAVGDSSFLNNNGGLANVGVGSKTGYNTTTGAYNSFFGFQSGYSNQVGLGNTAIGSNSGSSMTNTDYSVSIGYSANAESNNSSAIGANSLATTSNTIAFGGSDVTKWAFALSTTAVDHALEVGFDATNGNGAYLTTGGAWTNTSDINRKTDRSEVDAIELLEKIKTMPVERWKYEDTNEYHIGPYAADFNTRFDVGVDDKGISTVDPAGVSLAAIKELIRIVETQNALIADLQKRVDELEKK